MPAAAWVTLIIAALIIAITAVGLLRVIFHLRAIRATLRQVTVGVAAVAQLTSSVPERLTSGNASLTPVSGFCQPVCPGGGEGDERLSPGAGVRDQSGNFRLHLM